MCGRCVIFTYDEALEIVSEIESGRPVNIDPDWPARRPEARPTAFAPLIVPEFDTSAPRRGAGARGPLPGPLSVRELSWGFAEPWKAGVVFNTRIESAGKPMWRESMEHRRCVIPVPAFFETHRTETVPSPKTGRPIKRQYEFRVPGCNVILIGCIWRENSFSLVTTEANADMAPIHHRMPLIVRQEELPLWLGPGYGRLADRSGIRLEAQPAS